jgi:hypothetical protein
MDDLRERSFGVRQLAAAFLPASLLAETESPALPEGFSRILFAVTSPSQQAGWGKSGSKLPHSKASLAALGAPDGIVARTSVFEVCGS